ncbi:CBS domain-containing protein [Macrococcus equipercicus]|uniref:CBS domain-containing protein n=1 Tax=Macrococcus equipercicus TaxID=69967 RepID=A0A9Q9BMK4_9STAP|nr:CBS domain-containing protein [Macrococcus equipercicus]UTH13895.1 CBS domain-containing protein [Macrococcus equipercicus]
MNNFNQFIAEFNSLHKAMQKITGKEDDFGSLFHEMKETHSVIRRYKNQIDVARELRNLLVHNQTEAYNFAEPSNEFIKELKAIRIKLEKPETVSIFKKQVMTLDCNDSLTDALSLVKKYQVTQYPVFEDREFKGILSDNGITNWLSIVIVDEIVDLSEVKIADVLDKDEEFSSYIIVKNNLPLYEVEKKMLQRINERGHSNLVVLITPLGRLTKKEDIIGIITPWDMPHIVKHL